MVMVIACLSAVADNILKRDNRTRSNECAAATVTTRINHFEKTIN